MEVTRKTASFPDEVLEHVLLFVVSNNDRNSASLVCRAWCKAEALTRRRVFIGNCYSVSPQTVVGRFSKLTSISLKGKPRFSDFNMVPPQWGADIMPWLLVLRNASPLLEDLKLKRMTVSDESLCFIARSFSNFKVLSLSICQGFSADGLAEIASNCRNLTVLDIQECEIDDERGHWLSSFPERCDSLVTLNFSSLHCEVKFDALERLVARCVCLKTLKLNRNISMEQLQRLLVKAPHLTNLGTHLLAQDLRQQADLQTAFSNCKQLRTLSLVWEVVPQNLPALYSVCSNLTFLNLSFAHVGSLELASLIVNCHHLQRLWVLDSVQDKGLEAVASSCKELRELRVFPGPYGQDIHYQVTEKGILAISQGCPNLTYVLYFCYQMTNAAIIAVAQNCPKLTHFRLCIINPRQPDHLTGEPMDEAFGAIAENCTNLRRLSVSGLLTNKAFEYIGSYAKKLEILSVAFAGSSDRGMQCLLQGCPKLQRLEIRDSPFGDDALLSGLMRYESMRSLWMSNCKVTMNGCRHLAQMMPRLNVEIIKENEDNENDAKKVYVYRTIAGRRKDAPSFVLTL